MSLGRVVQGFLPFFVALRVRHATRGTSLLLWGTLLALAAHVLWALLFPHYVGVVGEDRLTGLLIANALGFAAGISVVAGILIWQSRLLGRHSLLIGLGLALAGSVTVALGIGRTAIVAVVFGSAAGLFVQQRYTNRRLTVAVALLMLLGVVLPLLAPQLMDWFTTGNKSVSTLTGRTSLWRDLSGPVLNSPLVGLGPGATRFATGLRQGYEGTVGQAHNSLVEALVSGGLPAASLWVVLMAASAKEAFSVARQYRAIARALWTALAIYSVTLGQLAGFGMAWFLLVALATLPSEDVQTLSMMSGADELENAGDPRSRGRASA
jgi:O-antigen ligase